MADSTVRDIMASHPDLIGSTYNIKIFYHKGIHYYDGCEYVLGQGPVEHESQLDKCIHRVSRAYTEIRASFPNLASKQTRDSFHVKVHGKKVYAYMVSNGLLIVLTRLQKTGIAFLYEDDVDDIKRLYVEGHSKFTITKMYQLSTYSQAVNHALVWFNPHKEPTKEQLQLQEEVDRCAARMKW